MNRILMALFVVLIVVIVFAVIEYGAVLSCAAQKQSLEQRHAALEDITQEEQKALLDAYLALAKNGSVQFVSPPELLVVNDLKPAQATVSITNTGEAATFTLTVTLEYATDTAGNPLTGGTDWVLTDTTTIGIAQNVTAHKMVEFQPRNAQEGTYTFRADVCRGNPCEPYGNDTITVRVINLHERTA